MKGRVGAQDVPPPELLTFDGRPFATYREWWAAFNAWCRRRHAWEDEHEVVLPEWEELGECPEDPESLMHGGAWSRPPHSDGPVVCAEHGLTPDEH